MCVLIEVSPRVVRGTFHPYLGMGRSTGSLVASLNSVASSCCRTGMSELPRRSTRLGGGLNTVENEDPPDETAEALAQRAAEESRSALLVSEQGIPANLYPDPGLPLTGPLTAMTKEVVEQSKAEPAAPRMQATRAIAQNGLGSFAKRHLLSDFPCEGLREMADYRGNI